MADRFISAAGFPDPPTRKMAVYEDLSGGLNLRELDYRLSADQSPEMENLWWLDGLLCCRDGQEWVSEQELGTGYCTYEELFHGHMVAHIGDGLYAAVPGAQMQLKKLCSGVPAVRGSFVRYQDCLLYKTRGFYQKVVWDGTALSAQEIQAYTPVTVINCSPAGAGDLYQPENRLSGKKTVWYTPEVTTHSVSFPVTAYSKTFTYETADGEPVAGVSQVYLDTTLLDDTAYTVSEDKQTVTLKTSTTAGSTVSVIYTVGVRKYTLPEENITAVTDVLVNGQAAEFTADLEAGIVCFAQAPAVSDPPENNTVHITYEKANPDAYNAIMDCTYGCAYGGAGGAVLILAGSPAQPNAYFWNGSHIAMDMGYFPMSYYNLAGDNLEPVTGFGQQAGYLMVFKSHSLGKCQLSATTIDDRAYLALDYTPVNAALGCDLPWTIRLVENNLVFCSTYAGVCRLDDTTPALENQVRCISRNILGSDRRPGLLGAVTEGEHVCALNDGQRYWVVADGKAFVWDYGLSSSSKPSWFYFTGIGAVSFFRADRVKQAQDDGLAYTGARRVYHLDPRGRISRFVRTYRDYGAGIRKVFTFATQTFGDMERQKHIQKIILTTRSDTDTVLRLRYATDHGQRWDKLPVRSYSWRLLPRNLGFRYLGIRRFAHVAVRVPGCRYVRAFSLRLENDEPGCDMSLVAAQIFADFVIKER